MAEHQAAIDAAQKVLDEFMAATLAQRAFGTTADAVEDVE